MFLRPGELTKARRRDLSLPSDRLEATGDTFLAIAAPEARRPYPAQHARCSDCRSVDLFER
eukprot:5404950-Pyramimonas_sp.AAC.1